jgi:hypothetical protein
MHCSVSSVERNIRIIFAVRVGLLVFHSLVRNLDRPLFGRAPLLSLNPSGFPLRFRVGWTSLIVDERKMGVF